MRAGRVNGNEVLLEVEDDGVGLTPYKLGQIQARLIDDTGEINLQETGFGLENVSKRIRLYYGKKYGLAIKSEYQHGTKVSLVIPLKKELLENDQRSNGSNEMVVFNQVG